VLYTRRGISDTVHADAGYIEERYGIRPDQYRDYAALRGDSSDNLPGVPGVGEKTATKLIAGYGDIDGVFAHLDEQTPKLKENLAAHQGQVMLNRELMDLVRTVAVELDGEPLESLDALRIEEWDRDRVKPVFDALAFRTLWDRLLEIGGQAAVEAESLDVEVRTALDADALPGGGTPLATALVLDDGGFVGLVVADGDGGVFIPESALAGVAEVFVDRSLVAHDAKPIIRRFLERELFPPAVAYDTALAAYVVNPAQRTPDLEELAYRELGLALVAPDDDAAAPTSQPSFDFEGGGPDLEAAAAQAVAVERLVPVLMEQVEARGGTRLMETIELPLIGILAQMEDTGIKVDGEFLGQLGDDLRGRLSELEAAIHAAAGGPFNVNSTLQLREVLFERLGLPILKKTPKGVPSTDASVLEKLRDGHPIVADLLQFRELEKLRSTYVDALVPLIDPDGRVRGRFNQMAAATGRLSQEQPNLQNIPVRSEEGRIIRRAFVAEAGARFLVADYSQIELRILAHLSGDAGLIDAFANDIDIHTATAARVAGLSPETVSPEQRRRAKMINFGLLYGMEAYGLAQRLGIERAEAAEQIDLYFAQFPDVQAFMRSIVDEARSVGYTTTILGRRRYLPELTSPNFRDRQAGERMALNAPIQGSAADIIKKAMVELDAALRARGSGAEMLLQIHDELVLEVPDDEFDAVKALTIDVMEGIVELDVPLRVTTADGPTLADCKA
jgi:DNA polymerase-1